MSLLFLGSLVDLLRIKAKAFVDASDLVAQLMTATLDPQLTSFDAAARDHIVDVLNDLATELDLLGLNMTKRSVEKLAAKLATPCTPHQCREFVIQIRDRLPEELEQTYLLALSPQQISKYDPAMPLFGNAVDCAFPSSAPEIVEVGKCMALERWTAAVMHLMRVLEPALARFQTAVDVSVPKANWQDILNQIDAKVKANGPKHPDHQWSSEASAQFMRFKDAWRNYAMHGKERYDEERASAIYESVRAFMQHLATRLSETP